MQSDFEYNGGSEKQRKDAYTSGDGSKIPNKYSSNSKGGIWDLTNPFKFAPYETGYCFLSVISAPKCMDVGNSFHKSLQDSFVNMMESEFKGLDGIEDITTETMDITSGTSTISMISNVNQQSNGQITMRFTEKTGSLITKYISEYLKNIRDPRSKAKRYLQNNISASVRKNMFAYEVFNFLYIITDASCYTVEKAFLLLNAQPTTAAYGELYNFEKGEIGVKELTVPFNAFVVDGSLANNIAIKYMRALVNHSDKINNNKINLNSANFNWSISVGNGNINTIDNLKFKR